MNCFGPGSVLQRTHTRHIYTRKQPALMAFLVLKTQACSVHVQRNITCISSHASQENKKRFEILAMGCTHSQNCAFVSNNVAFYFVSTVRPLNGDAMVSFGCSETISSFSVLTEPSELAVPFLRAS